MNVKLSKILYWLTIATFLVPLVVIPSKFIFPFIVPKIIVFRILVLCLFGVFIIAVARARDFYRWHWTPITIALGLFLLSFTVSTFLGTDWYHSFWDNHERMLGLFTIIHYVAYYVVISTSLRGLITWKQLLRYFVGAASLVMILGIFQKINPQFLLNNGSNRVSATLGNAIYLGGYGLFTFFMSVFLFTLERAHSWRWYTVFTGLLGLVGMFISGTRGSFIGFSAGLLVMVGMYAITLPTSAKIWKLRLITLGVAFLVILGILFLFRTKPFVANLPTVGSLLNTSLSGTAGTRLMAWEIAIRGWQDHPLIGWGPNNYFYAYNLYYKPEFLEHGWGETWFDNAHNIIMNTLTVQGSFGVLTYLGLFAVVVWVLVTNWRKGKFSHHVVSIGTAFLAAHLVQNIFVFENPTSYLFFMFFLAMVNSLSLYGTESSDMAPTSTQPISMVWRSAIGIVIALLIFVTDINPARANMNSLKLLRAVYSNNKPTESYESVLRIPSPHIDDIRNDFARVVGQVTPQYISLGYNDNASTLLRLAISELEKNRELHPYDLRVHINEAQLRQIHYQYFRSIDDIFAAEKTLEDALAKSPERQQVHYMLSPIKIILNKPDEAIQILRHSVDADPKIAEGWWRLAYTYKQTGHPEEARKVAQAAKDRGLTFDAIGQPIIDEILATSTK